MASVNVSLHEARDILVSVIVLSLALSIATGGGISVLAKPAELLFLISFFAVTVGSGFVLHEMAHKFVAIQFGGYAEFKMWIQGLLLALVFSLFGFVFAAPGAVYIYAPRVSRMQNGLISLAGPLMNMVLAFVFLAVASVYPLTLVGIKTWLFAAFINSWLGLFNMIPIFPLDGSKIMDWNIFVWAGFGAAFLAMVLSIGAF